MAGGSDDGDAGTRHGPSLIDRFRSLVHPVLHNDQLALIVLSIVVAAAATYGAIAFQELYLSTRFFAFGTTSEQLFSHVATLSVWQRILAPTLGGLIVGLLIRYLMPEQRPQASRT